MLFFYLNVGYNTNMVKNMKNNKGFTLIELIVTIGIMILIGLVIVNNMTGLFSNQEDKNYEEFVSQLQEAACLYVETSEFKNDRAACKANGCNIKIQNLIEKGYIKDTLENPKTGEIVNGNQTVHVYWKDNVKTCEFSE